ncbi:MAG: hypothetical protein HOE53_00015 [Candidatus Magasanikbacteria bacterium]|jgi:hypothetical protein|nr:hypothetical protein [Candidatus Magasanikbacteria bacterium]
MSEEQFSKVKKAILGHVQNVFDEIEESLAMQHQEKYSLLEDACENATDVSELKIAFQQWHGEHADDLELEDNIEDMWSTAITLLDEEEEWEDDEEEDEEWEA